MLVSPLIYVNGLLGVVVLVPSLLFFRLWFHTPYMMMSNALFLQCALNYCMNHDQSNESTCLWEYFHALLYNLISWLFASMFKYFCLLRIMYSDFDSISLMNHTRTLFVTLYYAFFRSVDLLGLPSCNLYSRIDWWRRWIPDSASWISFKVANNSVAPLVVEQPGWFSFRLFYLN